MRARKSPEAITAAAVCDQLARIYGIRATWEYPGFLAVVVPGGRDLAYGTCSGVDWCGHYDIDEDGRVPPGWEPEALPLDAPPSRIVAVLVEGVRSQVRR